MLTCPACSFGNAPNAATCFRCGAVLPHVAATVPDSPAESAFRHVGSPLGRLAPGTVVDGKYVIERVLGEGGMGVVYLATDKNTDVKVVVKSLHAALAREPEFRDRIRAEGRALAHIDHPNVVRLNAVVSEADALYLVMQYVEGRSLDVHISEHLTSRTPFSVARARDLFRQIVAGVGAAHREGLVHRDLKPANVLVRDRDGVAKVTDFGIAKDEADAKAGRGPTKGIIGSLWYMAPEQVTGQRDLDKRVDIYALGILLYELLVGAVPFDAASDYEIMKMIVDRPIPSVVAARPELPPAFDAFMARVCAKDRSARFSTCDELAAAFEQAFETATPAAPAVPYPAPPISAAEPSIPSVRPPPARPAATSTSALVPPDDVPPEAKNGRGGLIAAASVVALALALGAGYAAFGRGDDGVPPPKPTAATASAGTSVGGAPSSAPATPAVDPLDALVGTWISDSRKHYKAVRSGDSVEFRVVDPKELPRQNYQVDEPRFTLRKADASNFSVEDKIRPTPPTGRTYADASRGSCQVIISELGGQPLRASYGAGKLSVDLTNITPIATTWYPSVGPITSCAGLSKAEAERVESTLTKQ